MLLPIGLGTFYQRTNGDMTLKTRLKIFLSYMPKRIKYAYSSYIPLDHVSSKKKKKILWIM